MKKILLLTVLVVACMAASAVASGVGSAFGTMTTARSLGMGTVDLGTGVGIADATSIFATLNYGLSRYTDGRLKFGLYDQADEVNITLGADIKWQFWDVNEGRREPIDLAFAGFFEFLDVDRVTAFQFGAAAIGSYPFQLRNGGTLSPYGRFNVRLESLSFDSPFAGADDSDSDIRFGLNGGVAWQASPVIGLYGEFQIDGNDGIFLGINFNLQ